MSSKGTEVKIVLLGYSGTGKSNIATRLLRDIFFEEYDPSIEDNWKKEIGVDGVQYFIDILGLFNFHIDIWYFS